MKVLLSLGIGISIALTLLAFYGIGKAKGRAEEIKKAEEKLKLLKEAYINEIIIEQTVKELLKND